MKTTTLHRCAECRQPRALVGDLCRDCYEREWDAQIDAEVDRFGGATRLVPCPNCRGVGKVLGAWDIEEDCPADGCADGRVTIAERDAILERLDGLQHRSRP